MSESEYEYSPYHRARKRRTSDSNSEPNRSSILRMSDDRTLQLIDLYEKEECLWNTTLQSYKNMHMKIVAAERIAEKLEIPHFDRTHVTVKFKNLRNSYCQELKKIAASMNSGVSPEEVYRPKVCWFPKMHSFLRPHLKPSKNYTNIGENNQAPQEEVIIKKEEEESWVQYTNPEDVLIPETSMDCDHSIKSEHSEQTPQNAQSEDDTGRDTSATSSKKRKHTDDVEVIMKEISGQIQSLKKNEDYFDDFGKYVASLLRSMSKTKSLKLQSKIINLIVDEKSPHDNERISQSDEDKQ